MVIQIVTSPISKTDIKKVAQETFGDMVKAVVDIEKRIMAIGGEMHADEEAILLRDGSHQENLWGINLYPDQSGGDWIEFNSMINIRPRQGNTSRSVENPEIQTAIRQVVNGLVTP